MGMGLAREHMEIAHLTSTVGTLARELSELRALVSTCIEVGSTDRPIDRPRRGRKRGAVAGGGGGAGSPHSYVDLYKPVRKRC